MTTTHAKNSRWHLRTSAGPASIVTPVRPSAYVRLRTWAADGEHRVVEKLRPLSLPGLRLLLGLVFVWFGALKIVGRSPVADLVAGTLPWAPRHVVLPFLGTVEVMLGLGLLAGLGLRMVLPVLVAHLSGTFLTFVMLPALMFRHHDPLLLTENGEFVAKNLVLISAAIVLLTHAAGSTEQRRAVTATRTAA